MRIDNLFSKALLWKEWINYRGPLGVFLAALLGFYPGSIALALAQSADTASFYTRMQTLLIRIYGGGGAPLFFVTIGLVLGLISLTKERKENTFSLLLSMPFSRTQIFVNKFVFNSLAIVGVFLVNLLIMLAMWTASVQLQSVIEPGALLRMFGLQTMIAVGTYSFTVFFATISGSLFAASAFTLIFGIFPTGFASLILGNLWAISHPGLIANLNRLMAWSLLITPATYLGPDTALTYWYIIIGGSIVLFLLSLWLFKRNKLENNGELLVFPKMYPFLKVGVAVCFGLLAGGIASSLLLTYPIVYAIILIAGTALGWLLCRLLIKVTQTAV
ncbi:MAG: hypothetical protein FH749_04125 [Firmicutes bacterium]|nr:hypothetical protein [Bacillota bacterium]